MNEQAYAALLELLSVFICLAVAGPVAVTILILATWGQDLKEKGIKLR